MSVTHLNQVEMAARWKNARIGDGLVERERAPQHHHGQRLARPLSVLDHAALAAAIQIELADAFDSLADPEELLVARDLARAAIENRETTDQVQQTFRPAHRMDCAVLRRDRARTFGG